MTEGRGKMAAAEAFGSLWVSFPEDFIVAELLRLDSELINTATSAPFCTVELKSNVDCSIFLPFECALGYLETVHAVRGGDSRVWINAYVFYM